MLAPPSSLRGMPFALVPAYLLMLLCPFFIAAQSKTFILPFFGSMLLTALIIFLPSLLFFLITKRPDTKKFRSLLPETLLKKNSENRFTDVLPENWSSRRVTVSSKC